MAKQNVTFAERHLEKFIVGAAGLVLLGVIAYFGVMGPNTVNVQGENLGPAQFYEALKGQAASAQQSIKTKSAPKLPDVPRLVTRGAKGVHEGVKLPKDYMIAVAPPHPGIPAISGSDAPGDQILAEILPPKSVTVRAGQAYVALPPMEISRVGALAAQSSNPLTPVPADTHFVVVVAGFDRKAQADKFREVKYDETRCQLIAAGTQAQRRELGPDGRWSEPVLIVPGREAYAPRVLVGDAQIKPTPVDGKPAFADAERVYVDSYRGLLYSPEMQSEILRPPFQPLMDPKWQLAWQVPKTLPGFEFKLASFGVAFPAEGEKPRVGGAAGPEIPRGGQRGPMGPGGPMAMGPGGAQPPPAGPRGPVDLAAQKKARQALGQAREAAKEKKWDKFIEAIQQVLTDPNAPEKERKAAQDLLEEYDADIKKWQNEKQQADERDKSLGIVNLGEDQEPIWLTDIKVEPGKTYQYRLRVIAFNEFAGTSKLLKNPADAERVLIEGQWSEWSEPVTVTPVVQMFFTETRDDAGARKARVTVWAWSRGDWKEGKSDVEIGEPVEFARGRDKFTYDGIVTSLDNGREYRPRNNKGGYEPPVKTDVLTLVSAAGQVEERLLEEDKARLRAFRDWVTKTKTLLASPIEPGTGGNRPGGMQPLPTGRPGPGMYDQGMYGRPGPGMYDPRMGPGGPPGRGYGPGYGPRRGDPRFGPQN